MISPADPAIAHAAPTSAILAHLWHRSDNGQLPSVFAILDGARDKRILPMVNNSRLEHDCLFSGPMSYALRRASPHIVKLQPDTEFTHSLLSLGWGNAWGIFIVGDSHLNLPSIRYHFRRLARVQGPNGKAMLFRYFDPRVLRVFLSTCDSEQYQTVFGGLNALVMEDAEASTLLSFTPDRQQPAKTLLI